VRTIPPALQAKLDGGATTLARCFVVTRRDGAMQGFTDHDEDIVLDGVTCRARTGVTASEATQQLGLAVSGAEISGALALDTLNEADLGAGRYDAADVSVHLVDWSEPTLHVLLACGVLGEVRREGGAFTAELRSLAHRLQEESGRLYTSTCDADLGDARCTVDLTSSAYRGEGAVLAVTAVGAFTASGLDAFVNAWFDGGKLTWSSGANAGSSMEVKIHRAAAVVAIELWQAMPQPIAVGDMFAVTAGCDKRFATCRDRFANGVNFRGFPAIPGNDFLIQVPVPGEPGHDGTSMGPSA
jgi:uncharacterized phage protein (TIGR02218 family)